jgi:hypothetical protein
MQPHVRAFVERAITFGTCPDCDGTRLSEAARSAKLAGISIADACRMQISDLAEWVRGLDAPNLGPLVGSLQQLLDFFNQNETEAAKITVNISNVYNKLTGGLIINQKGPVTVIADGKSSVAPNGKLPAASILDAKGITLGKEDRVSVEKDGKTTILRVRRVTHGEETRTKEVPFGTQTKTAKSSRRTPSPTWMA